MNLDDKTLEELIAMTAALRTDPANWLPPGGSIYLFKPAIRRKLDKINREIADRLRQRRLARSETINDDGYSGRQSNKR